MMIARNRRHCVVCCLPLADGLHIGRNECCTAYTQTLTRHTETTRNARRDITRACCSLFQFITHLLRGAGWRRTLMRASIDASQNNYLTELTAGCRLVCVACILAV